MKFAGFLKNSFVDYPEKISAVVFTQGCNYRCWYCHNKQLIDFKDGEIDESVVFEFLKKRKGMIDGVVVTGGEPTLHKELRDFIKQIKELGFKVKLDTNGTNPLVVEKLIGENLLDYIAMDIKQDIKKYAEIVGDNTFCDNIKKSINLVMTSGVDYEFRTTVSPDITADDLVNISKTIKGAKQYSLQKCNIPSDKKFTKIPHNKTFFDDVAKIISKNVKKLLIKF